jgi:16S rRNA G966 N2-methylase RsmD
MSKVLLALPGISEASTITDMTSCVGGNVISFSRFFKKVNAIEIDPLRFDMLKHNTETVVGATNVNFINGNAVELLLGQDDGTAPQQFQQDILFMDPPWGGVDYK